MADDDEAGHPPSRSQRPMSYRRQQSLGSGSSGLPPERSASDAGRPSTDPMSEQPFAHVEKGMTLHEPHE